MSNIIGVRNNNTIVPLSSGSTMPAGTIIAYSGSIAAFSTLTSDSTTLYYKDGWAVCNGASISQTTFAQLYARIGAAWNTAVSPLTGSAQSAPTSGYFRIPNLQGTFLRGVGDFSDNTKDTTLAGFQADQLQGHKHELPLYYNTTLGAGGIIPDGIGSASVEFQNIGVVVSDPTYGTVRVGTETRPQNIGVYYLIKLYDNLAAVDVYIPPASTTEFGIVKKNYLYRAAATGRYTSANDGSTVLSKSIPAGTYRFTISGHLNGPITTNCAATMYKDGSMFYPLGGSDFENRAHLALITTAENRSSQTLTFIYTLSSTSTFDIRLSINGSAGIGNLSWTAETLENATIS